MATYMHIPPSGRERESVLALSNAFDTYLHNASSEQTMSERVLRFRHASNRRKVIVDQSHDEIGSGTATLVFPYASVNCHGSKDM
jgi:hypothetical protein